MLPYGEYVCILYSQPAALRLNDVKIVSCSVGCRMSDDEVVWWILSSVRDGKGER